jgi:pimeloyl-ACP methyl ester carboxylesterase
MIKELDEDKNDRIQTVLTEVGRQMATFGAFPQSPPSMPLVIVISGSENNLQPGRTMEQVRRKESSLLFSSSLPGHLINAALPLYPRDAWFARLPERLPPTLVIHADRDGKTPYEAAQRHIKELRKAGPVQLYTGIGGGHFVLWSDTSCGRAAVTKFVLGKGADKRCVNATAR